MLIPKRFAERGAVQAALDYYPKPNRRVFAYRYFTCEDREVGYTIPDTGGEHMFQPEPRVWSREFLNELEWQIDVEVEQ